MKLHEYQAVNLLRKYGIPTPAGIAVFDAAEAEKAANELGPGPYIVKAQIHSGGRGKAGGIRTAASPVEGRRQAETLLGSRLVTAQTGAEGKIVRCLLIKPCVTIKSEYYLSLTVDQGQIVLLASRAGGVEIEQTAHSAPDAVIRLPIDIAIGLRSYQARSVARQIGIKQEQVNPFIDMAKRLYQLFVENDCSLLEINPLAESDEGLLTVIDAKVEIDANALYRQPDLLKMRDVGEEDAKEAEAAEYGLHYIALNGNIGCLVNGAGLAMATMDIIRHYGGSPANFLDIGGGATTEKVTAAFRILLADQQIKGILVNIFGGIMRCDIVAQGIVEAAVQTGLDRPMVVRLAGSNAAEGLAIFQRSELPIIAQANLTQAVETIVSLASAKEEML